MKSCNATRCGLAYWFERVDHLGPSHRLPLPPIPEGGSLSAALRSQMDDTIEIPSALKDLASAALAPSVVLDVEPRGLTVGHAQYLVRRGSIVLRFPEIRGGNLLYANLIRDMLIQQLVDDD